MFKIIKNNLIPSVIAALIVVGFLVGIGLAVSGGSINIAPDATGKGLVGHWKLNSESEKSGTNISNGDFSTNDFTGWSHIGTATQTNSAATGSAVLTNTSIGTNYYRQSFTVATGKKYKYSFTVSGKNDVSSVQMRVEGISSQYINDTTVNGTKSGTFTAANSNVYLTIGFIASAGATSTATIDNIFIVEIQTADSTPNANHGTVYGATQNSDNMSFDGIDDLISISDDTSIQNIWDGSGSISFWVNPDNDGGFNVGRIISKNEKWRIATIEESGGNIRINLEVAFSGTRGDWKTTRIIPIGSWTHISIIYNSDNVSNDPTIYVNGASNSLTEDVAPTGIRTTDVSNDLYFGNNAVSGIYDFSGDLKDVRVYNYALSATEVTALYDLGGRQNQISTGSLYKGLVFHAPLNSESEKVGSVYTSDFSGGTDSWSNLNVVTSSENGIFGENNVLKIYANATNANHFAYQILVESNKTYRVSYDYYIPSGQTNVDGVSLLNALGGTKQTTTDAWTTFSEDIISVGTQIRIMLFKGVSNSFIGANNSADDIVYIKNFVIKEIQTADVTPNSNHGTVYGATQNADDMSFDGTNDFISSNFTNEISTSLSVSCWVKYITLNNTYNAILSQQISGAPNDSGWTLYQGGGTFILYFRSGASNFIFSEDTGWNPSLNTTYNISVTWDSTGDGKVRFYVDGNLEYTSSGSSNTAMSGLPKLLFGFLQWGDSGQDSILADQGGNTDLKDVRIYNRALTSTEVKALYDLGGRQRALSAGSLYKGLVLDMPLKEKAEKVSNERITDGGFEGAFTGGLNDNWVDVSTSTLTEETSVVHGGSKAQRFTANNNTGVRQNFVGFTIGKSYRAIAWVYVISGAAKMELSSDGIMGNVSTTGSWIKIENVFVATATSNNVRLYATSTSSDIIFDDVIVKELQTKDSTPYSNHGTVYGATVGASSTSFDGSSSYISIPSQLIETTHTVSQWVKRDSTGTNDVDYIFSGRDAYLDGLLLFSRTTTGLSSVINAQVELSTNSFTSDVWHHVVSTYDGTTQRLYMDGNEVDSVTFSDTISVTANNIIGRDSASGASNYWDGSISNVKIYNRALTATEVQLLYDKGR